MLSQAAPVASILLARPSCHVVASMAVSNFNCPLAESLQWQIAATNSLSAITNSIRSFLHLSYVLIHFRIRCNMHLRSVSDSDRHISEDNTPHSFKSFSGYRVNNYIAPDSHNCSSSSRHSCNSKRLSFVRSSQWQLISRHTILFRCNPPTQIHHGSKLGHHWHNRY